MNKQCYKCKKVIFITDFPKGRNMCKKCYAKKSYHYYHMHKNDTLFKRKMHIYSHNARQKLKQEVLSHYCSDKQTCCNDLYHLHPDEIITDLDLLTLDHINGGGGKDKKLNGKDIYHRLKRENYPAGFQVLCWNCQAKKVKINGEKKKRITS